MGCRLGRVKLVEENINQANKRMEQIEKIFEVLTNDGRLKDIINHINKNHCDSNSDFKIKNYVIISILYLI